MRVVQKAPKMRVHVADVLTNLRSIDVSWDEIGRDITTFYRIRRAEVDSRISPKLHSCEFSAQGARSLFRNEAMPTLEQMADCRTCSLARERVLTWVCMLELNGLAWYSEIERSGVRFQLWTRAMTAKGITGDELDRELKRRRDISCFRDVALCPCASCCRRWFEEYANLLGFDPNEAVANSIWCDLQNLKQLHRLSPPPLFD